MWGQGWPNRFDGVEVNVQAKSSPGKPTPLTVTVLPGGASEGDTKTVAVTAETTVKLAEALSPRDPFTVTRYVFPA